jgi:hypothetical protein
LYICTNDALVIDPAQVTLVSKTRLRHDTGYVKAQPIKINFRS